MAKYGSPFKMKGSPYKQGTQHFDVTGDEGGSVKSKSILPVMNIIKKAKRSWKKYKDWTKSRYKVKKY